MIPNNFFINFLWNDWLLLRWKLSGWENTDFLKKKSVLSFNILQKPNIDLTLLGTPHKQRSVFTLHFLHVLLGVQSFWVCRPDLPLIPAEICTLASHRTDQQSGRVWRLFSSSSSPDLQPFAPRTHVLPQQQVVECFGTDDVILLFDHLSDEVRVHTLLAHCGVEVVQMLKEDVHCSSALLWQNAPLPQACLYGA